MKCLVILALLCASSAFAGMPQLKSLKATWAPYAVPFGCSNAVVVLEKQTSLGSVFSPWKPTAYTPATRTNITFPVLPGLYHFRLRVQAQPLGQSDSSNVVTNTVAP